MFPFERYMKKLKGYVRNKAKPEGSIAEGYVAEEALTFSSHYFRDVTTKFNRPDRNVDLPPPTCQFQVFRSVCKSIGLRSVIRFDAQELKKVKWYVLHNSPEIDTYRSQFKSLFTNKDMKEEFPEWFGSQIRQHHVDNDKDPEVSTTSELFTLACGPTWTPILINSCVVDGVRCVMHIRDERRTTQNSGICSSGPDEEMYYGQLQEILEFKYLLFKVVLLRMSADVARSHGGDGGGKGKRKPNLGGRAAGRLNTRDKTRNLSLKEVTDKKGEGPRPDSV
ncbi:proton-dependent oligopeptide transporter family protein [Tanacetum coccineum]